MRMLGSKVTQQVVLHLASLLLTFTLRGPNFRITCQRDLLRSVAHSLMLNLTVKKARVTLVVIVDGICDHWSVYL